MAAVSQIALELIGQRRYLGAQKLAGGYTNKVWRVFCEDGAVYIVKSYRAPWTRANEEQAIRTLGMDGWAPQEVYARSATLLIWPDDGLIPLVRPRPEDLRAIGYALRDIHDRTITPADASEKPGWRTVNRIAVRGLAGSGIAADFGSCVHGDPCLENALASPEGRFVRFNDFEEFGPGDTRADLIQCLLETACTLSDWPGAAVSSILEGYLLSGAPDADAFRPVADPKIRKAIATAALNELASWAAQNKEEDLVARYRSAGPGAVDAIANAVI